MFKPKYIYIFKEAFHSFSIVGCITLYFYSGFAINAFTGEEILIRLFWPSACQAKPRTKMAKIPPKAYFSVWCLGGWVWKSQKMHCICSFQKDEKLVRQSLVPDGLLIRVLCAFEQCSNVALFCCNDQTGETPVTCHRMLVVYTHGHRLCSNWVRHGSTTISYPQCSLTFMRECHLHRSFAYAKSAVGIDVVSVHKLFTYRVVSTVSKDIVSSHTKYCRIAYGITR